MHHTAFYVTVGTDHSSILARRRLGTSHASSLKPAPTLVVITSVATVDYRSYCASFIPPPPPPAALSLSLLGLARAAIVHSSMLLAAALHSLMDYRSIVVRGLPNHSAHCFCRDRQSALASNYAITIVIVTSLGE
jgi:hypothetical protein